MNIEYNITNTQTNQKFLLSLPIYKTTIISINRYDNNRNNNKNYTLAI